MTRERILLPFATVFLTLVLGFTSVPTLFVCNLGWLELTRAHTSLETQKTKLTRVLEQSGMLATQYSKTKAMRAEAFLRKAVAHSSISCSAWRGLGFSLAIQGRDGDAVAAWQNAGGMTDELLERGHRARAEKESEEALAWYKWAGGVSGDWKWAWYYVGLAYRDMQRWDDARRSFQQACELDNRDGCYELGKWYADRKLWEQALAAFEKGVYVQTGRIGLSNVYHHIGDIRYHHLQPKDLEGAWKAYEKAISLSDYTREGWQTPELLKAGTYFARGLLLADRKQFAEAVSEYREAIEAAPHDYWSHVSMAKALWALGKKGEAEKTALTAVGIRPDLKNAYWVLGRFYESEGHIQDARSMYDKILEIDPRDESVLGALDSLTE